MDRGNSLLSLAGLFTFREDLKKQQKPFAKRCLLSCAQEEKSSVHVAYAQLIRSRALLGLEENHKDEIIQLGQESFNKLFGDGQDQTTIKTSTRVFLRVCGRCKNPLTEFCTGKKLSRSKLWR